MSSSQTLSSSTNSVPITTLSIARGYKRILERNYGGNVAKMARGAGKSSGYIDMYLKLNDLVPAMQRFLDPRVKMPKNERLSVTMAVRIAELVPETQNDLASKMELGIAGKTGPERRRWLDEQLIELSGAKGGFRAAEPNKGHQRDKLMNLPHVIRGRVLSLLGMSEREFHAVCSSMSMEDLKVWKKEIEISLQGLERLRARVNGELENKTSIDERIKKVVPEWIVVEYYEGGKKDLRVSGDAVSPERYQHLGSLGWLAWQIDGLPKPDDLPAVKMPPRSEVARTAAVPEKPPAPPQRPAQQPRTSSAPAPRRPPLPSVPRSKPVELGETTKWLKRKEPPPEAPKQLTFIAWEMSRYVTKTTDLEGYLDFLKKGDVKFQKERTERPANLPSQEQVEEWLGLATT